MPSASTNFWDNPRGVPDITLGIECRKYRVHLHFSSWATVIRSLGRVDVILHHIPSLLPSVAHVATGAAYVNMELKAAKSEKEWVLAGNGDCYPLPYDLSLLLTCLWYGSSWGRLAGPEQQVGLAIPALCHVMCWMLGGIHSMQRCTLLPPWL